MACPNKTTHIGMLATSAYCLYLSEFNTILTNIPLQTGFIPRRWPNASDSMLLKKKGELQADKLQTII